MAEPFFSAKVAVIGKDIVDAKLLAAAPRILEENRLMVKTMLDYIEPIVVANTPVGPGRLGNHLRDTFRTDVTSKGVTTTGVLRSAVQGYWREYGTRGRFRNRKSARRAYTAAIGGFGDGGERAFMTAHHAMAGIKRFIDFYYGKAQWWRL